MKPCVQILPYNRIKGHESNKLMTHSITWINLRSMMLNQRSQTQNVTDGCRIPFIGQSGRSKRTGTEISPGDASAGGVGRERADDRQTGFLEAMERFFIRTVVVTTAPHGNSVSHWSLLTLQPHEQQPARFLCAWDSPGKNTGVGCHDLLRGSSPLSD